MNRGLYILLIGLVIQGISAGIQSKRKFNSKILMKKIYFFVKEANVEISLVIVPTVNDSFDVLII